MSRRRLTREERKARTRSELLQAAAKVFARRGFHGASVPEIAEEAGYSHGAVYSNFSGKEELFLALYEEDAAERSREIRTALGDAHGSFPERAKAAADQWVRRFSGQPEKFLLSLEFLVYACRQPELRERLGMRVGAVPLTIAGLIEEHLQQSGLEYSLPPEELALVVRALGLGLSLESLAEGDRVRPGLYGEFVALLFRLLEADATRVRSDREVRGGLR